MSPDTSVNQTEVNQIDLLIEMKKDEISALEDLKKTFTDDYEPAVLQTPAQVTQDESASSAERAAAANATLGQDPVKVNAEQSFPTPSTHDEAKEPAKVNEDNSHPLGGDNIGVAPDGELVNDDDSTPETEDKVAEDLETTVDDSKSESKDTAKPKSTVQKAADKKPAKTDNKKADTKKS